jgi:hypothetical protein
MLVPLETFSGWPQVANPSPLQSLGLLVGIPLLIAVIVIALIELRARARARRGDDPQAGDPLWVGARESAEVEPVSDHAGTITSDQATREAISAQENVESGDTGEHVGGAGARW